jgi:hypothetical protein
VLKNTEPEDFAAECARKFRVHIACRNIAPFHVDKRKYEAKAWAEVDAYLEWLEVQKLKKLP